MRISENTFLVCSFGGIATTKQSERLLDVWNESLGKKKDCKLIFVGANADGEYGSRMIRKSAKGGGRITDYVDRQTYLDYLRAADLAVQLRTLSRGESSGAVLDCFAHGVPTIINANGAMAEIPPDCAFQLPDEFKDQDLASALVCLYENRSDATKLANRAEEYVGRTLSPYRIGKLYYQAIEEFEREPISIMRSLESEIAQNTLVPDIDFSAVAASVANLQNYHYRGPKQTLIDVSSLLNAPGDGVLSQEAVKKLMLSPPQGHVIEPIFWREGNFYYARSFAMELLHLPDDILRDELIDARSGDVFVISAEVDQANAISKMRNRGIDVIDPSTFLKNSMLV